MIYFTIFCFLCFGSSFGSLKEISSEPAELIVGGQNADIKDFPYQLSLGEVYGDTYWHFCGASIINPSWALSAAHCVVEYRSRKEDLRIRSGSSIQNKGGMLHHVQEFMVHPNYNPNLTKDYDVSVIKVLEPFVLSKTVKPIELSTETPPVGTEVVLAGWGFTGPKRVPPEQLQTTRLFILDTSVCQEVIWPFISPRMLCATGAETGQHAFIGDSGGALVAQGKQVGIVSFGINETYHNKPGVYTDVASVVEWIKSTIDQHL